MSDQTPDEARRVLLTALLVERFTPSPYSPAKARIEAAAKEAQAKAEQWDEVRRARRRHLRIIRDEEAS